MVSCSDLDHVRGHVWSGFEYLRGWMLRSFSGQPVLVFDHLFKWNFLYFVVAYCLELGDARLQLSGHHCSSQHSEN